MILNINGDRISAKHIIHYRKRVMSDERIDVLIELEHGHRKDVMCWDNEAIADAVLSLIDDAFENEINLTDINVEHIKGNLDRADKDAF